MNWEPGDLILGPDRAEWIVKEVSELSVTLQKPGSVKIMFKKNIAAQGYRKVDC